MNRILIFLLLIFAACKKAEIPRYSGGSSLSFMYAEDSLSYSFVLEGAGRMVDTIYIPIYLTGLLSDQDRAFELEILPQSTAVKGQHYELTDMLFPAKATTYSYPIIIYNHADLTKTPKTLKIGFRENKNFQLGATGSFQNLGATAQNGDPNFVYTFPTFQLKLTNVLAKPTTWNVETDYYFGAYSNAKFLFMMEVLKMHDFRTTSRGGKVEYADILNFLQRLRIGLKNYELSHGGPLLDEFGQRVII